MTKEWRVGLAVVAGITIVFLTIDGAISLFGDGLLTVLVVGFLAAVGLILAEPHLDPSDKKGPHP